MRVARPQTIEAPCKVNLHLGIHARKDERSYHYVDSVMVPVGLFDEVRVEDAPEFCVRHEPALAVPPERTTVWKAATLLAHELGKELDLWIDIRTRIPESAGLGGSSADAGAALRALAARWGLDALDPRVVKVARAVGADVPFFLNPAPSLYLGGGDVLTEVFPAMPLAVALVMPRGKGVSASAAYGEFDRKPSEPTDYEPLCEALRSGDAAGVRDRVYNNLADAAKALQPGCAEVEGWLSAQPEARTAMVSGSGSCVFALCDDLESARTLADRARSAKDWWSFATLTVGTSAEVC